MSIVPEVVSSLSLGSSRSSALSLAANFAAIRPAAATAPPARFHHGVGGSGGQVGGSGTGGVDIAVHCGNVARRSGFVRKMRAFVRIATCLAARHVRSVLLRRGAELRFGPRPFCACDQALVTVRRMA